MLIQSTNIEDKLRKHKSRNTSHNEILHQVKAIFDTDLKKETRIENELSSGSNFNENHLNFDLLETENIFHISSIRDTCIDYRLRFLDSKYFKNQFPQEAISKIKTLEKSHNIILQGFKVMAPSKLFKLENPDDPLLFIPIGNDYFYLVHKWGNDLHPFRKWLMLPFKTFENLILSALIVSFLLTYAFNSALLADDLASAKFLILFLFVFKSVVGIIIFYAFSQGKNFNTVIWNSKYSK